MEEPAFQTERKNLLAFVKHDSMGKYVNFVRFHFFERFFEYKKIKLIVFNKDNKCLEKDACSYKGKCKQKEADFNCDCQSGYFGKKCENCKNVTY